MNDVDEIFVTSEKYGVEGRIINAINMVVKLVFSYEGRQIEMGMPVSTSMYDVREEAVFLMESYIENLQSESQERKVQMHYWYITKMDHKGTGIMVLHGRVSGHERIADTSVTHTSYIVNMDVDFEKEELLVQTRNTFYHCPLEYCYFEKQDEYPELVPEYKKIQDLYKGKHKDPLIEAGKVLLVISNFDEYYFHSLCCIADGKTEPQEYTAVPHIGTYQDSFLIYSIEGDVHLSYFPHFQNIEFYTEHTSGMPWFVENIGSIVLYARTSVGTLKLNPGERKEVCRENAETDVPALPSGDLYPAGICF